MALQTQVLILKGRTFSRYRSFCIWAFPFPCSNSNVGGVYISYAMLCVLATNRRLSSPKEEGWPMVAVKRTSLSQLAQGEGLPTTTTLTPGCHAGC